MDALHKLILFSFLIFSLGILCSAQPPGPGILKLKWNWVIRNILCLILFISGGIAALVIIMAGMKYISSQSPRKIDEAKKRILYAVVGLILVFLATPLVNYLVNSFSPEPEKFNWWCATLNGNITGNATCNMQIYINSPGPDSELENGTPIHFVGYGWSGNPSYTFEWSSNPGGISRSITQTYSQDSFYESLSRGEYTIQLKVTDAEGCTGTTSVDIKVIVSKPPVT